jgi:hypothetical protein
MEQTVVTFDGLVAREEVKIRGERGTFKIRSFRVEEGICLWVTVIGGTSGHSAFRHFSYDRIVRIKKRREVKK